MRKIAIGFWFIVAVVLSFWVGRWVENGKSSYRYEVIEEKKIEGAVEDVYWRNVYEAVGAELMGTNTTMIEADGRLIYKARRVFQESDPVARNVRVNEEGEIEWEDGEYSYRLRMKKMEATSRPATMSGIR